MPCDSVLTFTAPRILTCFRAGERVGYHALHQVSGFFEKPQVLGLVALPRNYGTGGELHS